MLLKDVIYGEDGILLNYYLSFSDKGKDIKKLAREKGMINYETMMAWFLKQVILLLNTLNFQKYLVQCIIY